MYPTWLNYTWWRLWCDLYVQSESQGSHCHHGVISGVYCVLAQLPLSSVVQDKSLISPLLLLLYTTHCYNWLIMIGPVPISRNES